MFGGLGHGIGEPEVVAVLYELSNGLLVYPRVLPQPVGQLPADFEEILYIPPHRLIAQALDGRVGVLNGFEGFHQVLQLLVLFQLHGLESVLLQFDFATSVRSALSTVAVNLLSGVLASLAFAFVELRPSLPFLFLTVLLVGLILGGRATAGRAKMFAGALTTFLILFGLGLAPIGDGSAAAFMTRIVDVALAWLYAIGAITLFSAIRRPSENIPA